MIIRQRFIAREDLWNNPKVAYLFGDNRERRGLGGQASEMRGEPNAFGIRVKKAPKLTDDAYLTDDELEQNISDIVEDFNKVCDFIDEQDFSLLIIPSEGIGTGLAELETRAPQTFKFLQALTIRMVSDIGSTEEAEADKVLQEFNEMFPHLNISG